MALLVRPFAFNPGGFIDGTEQVGDLTIGTPTAGFTAYPSIKFWNGPSENGRIIACYPDPAGNHIGADGEAAFIGFRAFADEAALIEWTTSVLGATPADANEAKASLHAAGIWTSYVISAAGTAFNSSISTSLLNLSENCLGILTNEVYYHNGEAAYPIINDIVYIDSAITLVLPSGWYNFDNGSYYRVVNGTVIEIQVCLL